MDRKQIFKLLSYFTMGDGGVYFSGNNCRFVMNMLEKNQDYVEWVASVCREITGTTVRQVNDFRDNRKQTLNVTTKAHPVFTTLRNRIYVDNYKSLDPHALKMLDWESLAILYMCDGGLYVEKPNPTKGLVSESPNVFLHMKRLSYGDFMLLKKALKDHLDLEWNIKNAGKYHTLRLRNKDVSKFMDGIAPFICPSFEYKLFRTKSPKFLGDDIVCATQECVEISRND